MGSQASRGFLRRILILTSAVFILVGLVQVSASAGSPPWPCDEDHLENLGLEWEDEFGAIWKCTIGAYGIGWYLQPVPDSPEAKRNTKGFTTSNPASRQLVSAFLRWGSGGGVYEGGQQIFNGSGVAISRPMRTRVVIKYYRPTSGWVTCRDSGWIDNGTRHWSHNGRSMGTQPDCGRATYGVKTAGIYWSTTLGRWLGGTWVLSGNLGLPGGTATQAGLPEMTGDPLNLPPAL
jgi:hypothetical protein